MCKLNRAATFTEQEQRIKVWIQNIVHCCTEVRYGFVITDLLVLIVQVQLEPAVNHSRIGEK